MADCTNENWVQIRDFPNYKISEQSEREGLAINTKENYLR